MEGISIEVMMDSLKSLSRSVDERPMCLATHEINATTIDGFELKVTYMIKEEL